MQHEGVILFARLFALASRRAPPTPLRSGIAALERRQPARALALFREALAQAASAPDAAAAHNKCALAHLALGDRIAAIAALCDALASDARNVAAIVNLGNLLFEDGAVAEAIVHYEAALRIDDGDAAAHLNLGIAYKRLGRRADAVREFRRASRLDARLLAGRRAF